MKIIEIELKDLHPCAGNVRSIPDKADPSMKASIEAHGLINPITIRERLGKGMDGWEIVAGYQRFACARDLGWETISCIKAGLDNDQAAELSLAENYMRVPLNPMDACDAFMAIIKSAAESGENATVDGIAGRFGISEHFVRQRIALASLPLKIRDWVRKGKVSFRVAEALTAADPAFLKKFMAAASAKQPDYWVTRADDIKRLLSKEAVAIELCLDPDAYKGERTTDLFPDSGSGIMLADRKEVQEVNLAFLQAKLDAIPNEKNGAPSFRTVINYNEEFKYAKAKKGMIGGAIAYIKIVRDVDGLSKAYYEVKTGLVHQDTIRAWEKAQAKAAKQASTKQPAPGEAAQTGQDNEPAGSFADEPISMSLERHIDAQISIAVMRELAVREHIQLDYRLVLSIIVAALATHNMRANSDYRLVVDEELDRAPGAKADIDAAAKEAGFNPKAAIGGYRMISNFKGIEELEIEKLISLVLSALVAAVGPMLAARMLVQLPKQFPLRHWWSPDVAFFKSLGRQRLAGELVRLGAADRASALRAANMKMNEAGELAAKLAKENPDYVPTEVTKRLNYHAVQVPYNSRYVSDDEQAANEAEGQAWAAEGGTTPGAAAAE